MSKLDYTIKLVYPDWVIDDDRDKRMGFGSKYKNFNFPIGAKMLIYLIELQLIMGINTVTGTWIDGEKYPSRAGYPIKLPVILDYESTRGVGIREIQRVVPLFHPHKDMSFFPITEEQHYTLEKKLKEMDNQ